MNNLINSDLIDVIENESKPRGFIEVLVSATPQEDGLCLYPAQDLASLGMLRFLMEQHKLPQSRLPEIGTQGVVSEILSGKHDFNVRQIKALSERFKVPPSVFI